jgi:hypothetical protein
VLEENMTEVNPLPKEDRAVRLERDHLLIAAGVLSSARHERYWCEYQ